MNVKEAIKERRAYRSLKPVKITEELIEDLAKSASLSASCFNKQPWRLLFVYNKGILKQLSSAVSKGNEWTHNASMIIAVFSKKDLDCVVQNREYYLFDVGMATAYLILRATELGLVAHPIAGYNENKVKEILEIPHEMLLITLVIVGKHSEKISSVLSNKQIEWEKNRPERLLFEKFAYMNRYSKSENEQ